MREMLTGGRRRLATLATVAVTGLSVVGVGFFTTSGAGAANAHHEPRQSHPEHEARCRPPLRHHNHQHRVHHHRAGVPVCRPDPTTTTSRPEGATTSVPEPTTSVPETTTTVPETTTTTVQPCPGHIVNGVCIVTG
ncbi:MAG: hypothetical protein QOF59_62 [Actinomycetota bacterium]|nr:hypothetical protein [Actinomycetota bacterium]